MLTRYDEVLYPTAPRKESHPERLALMAHLRGLQTAPLARSRVLELGCGDGGNIIPIAYDYPEAQFLGVDLAESPLALGRQFCAQFGLRNIELVQGDLSTWTAPGREFDYILVHGIYSWVPPAAREGILRICRQNLAPNGVAFISYNALPGCYFRKFIWDMMKFHTRGIDNPREKVAAAKELAAKTMDALGDEGHPSATRIELQELISRHDGVVFHDDLSEFNEPFYVEEFTAHAARHGLQYLSDADSVREHGLPYQMDTTDRAQERQYADFLVGRRFRETLLCREALALEPSIRLESFLDLWVGSKVDVEAEQEDGTQTFVLKPGRNLSTNSPVAKAVLVAASAAWPLMMPARDLPLSGEDPAADLDCLVRLLMAGALEFRVEPPKVAGVTERPQSSPLARAMVSHGLENITNQRHYHVNLGDEVARELVLLLDGTRDHGQIAAALADKLGQDGLPPDLRGQLDASLKLLARLSLLTA